MKVFISTVILIVVLGAVQSTPVVDQDLNAGQELNQYLQDEILSTLLNLKEKESEISNTNKATDLSEALEQELEADKTEVETDENEVEAEETEVEADEEKDETEVKEDEIEVEEDETEAEEYEDEVEAEGTEVEVEEDQNEVVEVEKKETEVKTQSTRRVMHGSTIALQTYQLNQWLSCAGSPCRRSSCARMIFSSHDYRRCAGDVFKIVRRKGSGIVRSGDAVAIYYPNGKQWLRCSGRYCTRSNCPGTYQRRYGFQSQCRWDSCPGEVFRIYKRGQRNGAIIMEGDKVAFYYVAGRLWLSQSTIYTQKSRCLGTRLPPVLNQYDNCPQETFIIDML